MASELPSSLLANTYGARLLASYGATGLYGVLCLQVFIYYNTYPKDRMSLKLLVLWIWVVNTVHQGMLLAYEYNLLIRRFGDIAPITKPYVDINVTTQAILNLLIAIPVQFFFLYRIYRLSGDKLIFPIFLTTCVTGETVTGLFYYGRLLATQNVAVAISRSFRSTGTAHQVITAFVDLAISLSMVYLLRSARVAAMSQARRMLAHLIIYSVNTGLWTALLAISSAVTIIFYPTSFVYVALSLPISSLYANTLLANLNVREHVRGMYRDVLELSLKAPGPKISGSATANSLKFMHTDPTTAKSTVGSPTVNFDGSKITESEIDDIKGPCFKLNNEENV
ncbi:hypothetical protein C8R43DRAFT_998304 [Mycena crocata]|nr:hypothetical protein C8R43DRAFT_998304 [Mycena crocata]